MPTPLHRGAPPAEVLPGAIDLDHDGRNGDGGTDGGEEEHSSELVVWPECWTHLIDSLQPTEPGRKKYQIAIWWLSVDNNKGRFLPSQFALRRDVLHLAQSAYAREYVSSRLERAEGGGKGGEEGWGEGGGTDSGSLVKPAQQWPFLGTASRQLIRIAHMARCRFFRADHRHLGQ